MLRPVSGSWNRASAAWRVGFRERRYLSCARSLVFQVLSSKHSVLSSSPQGNPAQMRSVRLCGGGGRRPGGGRPVRPIRSSCRGEQVKWTAPASRTSHCQSASPRAATTATWAKGKSRSRRTIRPSRSSASARVNSTTRKLAGLAASSVPTFGQAAGFADLDAGGGQLAPQGPGPSPAALAYQQPAGGGAFRGRRRRRVLSLRTSPFQPELHHAAIQPRAGQPQQAGRAGPCCPWRGPRPGGSTPARSVPGTRPARSPLPCAAAGWPPPRPSGAARGGRRPGPRGPAAREHPSATICANSSMLPGQE